MKKYLKVLFLILPIIYFSFCVYNGASNFKVDHDSMINAENRFRENCTSIITEGYEDICSETDLSSEVRIPYSDGVNSIIFDGFQSNLLVIILIILPPIYYVSRFIKSKMLLNDITRMSYGKCLSKIFGNCYKYAFIFPIFIIVIFILSYLITGSFDLDFVPFHFIYQYKESTISSGLYFSLILLFNVIMYMFIFINISLVCCRFKSNFFISFIICFLTIIGIELFLEVFVDGILCNIIFGSSFGTYISLINFTFIDDKYGVLISLLISFIMFILSFAFVYFTYRDKEKFIAFCESGK